MTSRYRTKVLWAFVLLGTAAAIVWIAITARQHQAAEQANRLIELGVVLQRTKPWRIEQINRWPADLPPEEVRSLLSFPSIKLLNLQGGAISDAELPCLAQLPHLESLVLGHTQITDRGLAAIAKIPSLKNLGLEHADVTNVGVRELKRLRPEMVIEVYEVSLVGLRHLKPYLPHGRLDEDYELIALDLHGSAVTDDDLPPIAKCNRLRMLNLSETSIGDAGLRHLAPLVNLEELWLRGTNVTDDSLAVIGQMKNLRALSLAETVISDAGVEQLRDLVRLETLHLGNTQVSDAGLQSLQRLTSLKTVYVTNSFATDEGAAALTAALPDTKVIVDPAAADRAKEIESQVLG